VEFRILGPLEVVDRGRPVPIGGGRQRSLLALLLLNANELVSADRLLEELWGDAGRASPNALQVAVSRLRHALGWAAERLVTQEPGYVLRVGVDELDVARFEALVAEGRRRAAGGDASGAAAAFRAALGLWRGGALADFVYEPFAQLDIARLEELRVSALEERVDADLAVGGCSELVGELQAAVAEHPLRERSCGQLMLALYRCGRQAEALAAYRQTRETLVEELGVEPGAELRQLESRILRQDASLEGARVPVAAIVRARKLVTVVVIELRPSMTGGGRVDPEALEALDRCLPQLTVAVQRHGGIVAHAVGERVVAVFGIPRVHEDDVPRAARAALEIGTMAQQLDKTGSPSGIRVGVAVGISTGEVLAGEDGDGAAVVLGDVAREAERLAEGAAPGEVLVAGATAALGAEALELESSGRGRRLVGAPRGRGSVEGRSATPWVGRKAELGVLRAAFGRAVSQRSAVVVTVLGEAGIGKTRLAYELAADLEGSAAVVVGGCLSYGEGTTFWPLRELVAAAQREAQAATLRELLGGEPDGERVAERIDAALGAEGGVGSIEEIFWATRRLLETLARRRPLVVVLDDLHWAEPTFLDLVDHVGGRAAGPLLVVCLGRPELLEARPRGLGEIVALGPLADAEVDGLIEALGGEAAVTTRHRARVKEVAEGNPLFLEQVVALLAAGRRADAEVVVPPSIDVLLVSRVERLGPGERSLAECAAIVGTEFTVGDVVELLPDQSQPTADRLVQGLIRKRIVRAGPDGHRFAHVLMHDAVYRSVPKSRRAALHEAFAQLLEERGEASSHPEILGYHLEQAFACRRDVEGEANAVLGRQASAFLAQAAARATDRQDVHAAADLGARALALVDEDDPCRIGLLHTVGVARLWAGDFASAETTLSEAMHAAERAGDDRSAASVRLSLAYLPEGSLLTIGTEHITIGAEHMRLEARRAIETFGACGDERGLAQAWNLLGLAEAREGHALAAEAAFARAAAHARRAGDQVDETEAILRGARNLALGPRPVSEASRRCEELLEQARGHPSEVVVPPSIGLLRALSGRFDEARPLVASLRPRLEELGRERAAASLSLWIGLVELLAEDWSAAEQELRPALETHTRLGARFDAAVAGGLLARALCGQRRHREALEIAETAMAALPPDSWSSFWATAAKARALAGLGNLNAAQQVGREALAIVDRTDMPLGRARARVDLAEILLLVGNDHEAAVLLADAIAISNHKQDVVTAARARVVQDQLTGRPTGAQPPTPTSRG
jgi:DNA-binding SARP family transcriptional activator/tetratricopeptide (TPR) repeat protein